MVQTVIGEIILQSVKSKN